MRCVMQMKLGMKIQDISRCSATLIYSSEVRQRRRDGDRDEDMDTDKERRQKRLHVHMNATTQQEDDRISFFGETDRLQFTDTSGAFTETDSRAEELASVVAAFLSCKLARKMTLLTTWAMEMRSA